MKPDPQLCSALRLTCIAGLLLAPMMASAQIHGAGAALTGQRRPLQDPEHVQRDRPYALQIGDVVHVDFRYTPEFDEDALVGPDGMVSLKASGSLRAAGLSVSQLESAIASTAKARLVNPEIAVTLKEFDRPHVFVAGEVNTPGRQDLRRPTTVTQAILMCGGPKDDAAMGRVLLFRHIDAETAEVHVLQLSKFNKKSRGENDMLLEPNDMILVRHDLPSRVERYIKLANVGFYLNPLQNVAGF